MPSQRSYAISLSPATSGIRAVPCAKMCPMHNVARRARRRYDVRAFTGGMLVPLKMPPGVDVLPTSEAVQQRAACVKDGGKSV